MVADLPNLVFASAKLLWIIDGFVDFFIAYLQNAIFDLPTIVLLLVPSFLHLSQVVKNVL